MTIAPDLAILAIICLLGLWRVQVERRRERKDRRRHSVWYQ